MAHKGTTALFLGLFLLASFTVSAENQDRREDQTLKEQTVAPAQGQTPAGITGTATLGVFNTYIFRGYELSRDSLVVQPNLTVSWGGFSAGFWGNIDTREKETPNFAPDRRHQRSWNETDLTLSYTRVFGKVAITGGWIYYNTDYVEETQEVFGTILFDTVGKPTLTVYRDIDRYPGTYLNLSLAHSIALGRGISLDLGASAGYMEGDGSYWRTPGGAKYSAFHDGMLKAGLTVPLTKKVSFTPLVQYWVPLSREARKRDNNPNGYLRTHVVGGANVSYSF